MHLILSAIICAGAAVLGAVAEGLDAVRAPFAKLMTHPSVTPGQIELNLPPAQSPPELRVSLPHASTICGVNFVALELGNGWNLQRLQSGTFGKCASRY